MKDKLSKHIPELDNEPKMVACANCGKEFLQSNYSLLCDCIMKHKPVCSYECNKALGQVP